VLDVVFSRSARGGGEVVKVAKMVKKGVGGVYV